MRRSHLLLAFLLFTALRPPPAAAQAADGGPTGEAAAESLRAAEIAFAASVAEGDLERFASFLDEEAVFASGSVLRGREEILRAWSVFFAEDGPRIAWHPEIVEVRPDGLGLSRGPYTLTATAADGGVSESRGTFMSIWRRQPDGGWRILFDSGCPPGGGEAAVADDG